MLSRPLGVAECLFPPLGVMPTAFAAVSLYADCTSLSRDFNLPISSLAWVPRCSATCAFLCRSLLPDLRDSISESACAKRSLPFLIKWRCFSNSTASLCPSPLYSADFCLIQKFKAVRAASWTSAGGKPRSKVCTRERSSDAMLILVMPTFPAASKHMGHRSSEANHVFAWSLQKTWQQDVAQASTSSFPQAHPFLTG